MVEVSDELLRSALEVAFVVAVVGARQRPPLAVPAALRPFLKMQKLPERALAPVRRAVEADDEFRDRVASVANADSVDAIGLLWLQRPEGWSEQLEQLALSATATESAQAEERAERQARRRLEGAEEAVRRAQAEVAAARTALAAASDGLGAERERRALAEGERDVALGRVAELEDALERSEARANEARSRASDADRRAAALEVELSEALVSLSPPAPPLVVGEVVPAQNPEPDTTAFTAPAPFETTGFDRIRVADAIERAAKALAEAAAALSAGSESVSSKPALIAPVRPFARIAAARRVALVLPGLFSESREAAEWLVRAPGITVLVDGYNVSKLAWPDASLEEQRGRLVDALAELSARYSTAVQVIFDGAGVVSPGHHRRGVRVGYSPLGVSADDRIVELVQSLPPERPIVVATSDNELRRRVARLGANVVTSPQLLDVLGR